MLLSRTMHNNIDFSFIEDCYRQFYRLLPLLRFIKVVGNKEHAVLKFTSTISCSKMFHSFDE